jgi:hypothetical protein
MKVEFFSADFRNLQIANLIKNPFMGTLVVPCGRADRQTYMTKLIVAFLNFANAAKNSTWCSRCIYVFCTDLRKSTFTLCTPLNDLFITEVERVLCLVRTVLILYKQLTYRLERDNVTPFNWMCDEQGSPFSVAWLSV